jgi:hypothetical protein
MTAVPMTTGQVTYGSLGKIRSPGIVILLSIVTLGIYGLYWQYSTFKEMKDHTGQGIGGGVGLLLAILLGIVNVFLMPAEVGNMYAAEGQVKPISGVSGFWVFLPIVGSFIWIFKVQGNLNRYWAAHGGIPA